MDVAREAGIRDPQPPIPSSPEAWHGCRMGPRPSPRPCEVASLMTEMGRWEVLSSWIPLLSWPAQRRRLVAVVNLQVPVGLLAQFLAQECERVST